MGRAGGGGSMSHGSGGHVGGSHHSGGHSSSSFSHSSGRSASSRPSSMGSTSRHSAPPPSPRHYGAPPPPPRYYGAPRPRTRVYREKVVYRDRPVYQNGQPASTNSSKSQGNGFNKFMSWAFVAFAIMLIIGVIGISDSKSVQVREKINSTKLVETAYYVDEMDDSWISSKSDIERGMKQFYEATGVQPVVVLADDVNGDATPSEAAVIDYAGQKYIEICSDEAHIVVVIFDSAELEAQGEDFIIAWEVGNEGYQVLDDEACEVLYEHLATNYYKSNLTAEEFISEAFGDSAKVIMKSGNNIYAQLTGFAIAGMVISGVIVVTKNAKEKKRQEEKEKAEETERILNTPMEKLVDEAEELASKYEGNTPTEG